MLLAPLRVSLTNAALTYVKLTKDLEAHGISLSQAIEEYKSLAKLKERSARLDFAIDKYCYTLLKKELSSEYVTGVERTLARFMGDFGKERIVSLITGREIFQWLINLKKREYDDSEITKTASHRIVKIPENLAKWLAQNFWDLGTKKKILTRRKVPVLKKLHESLGKGNWIKNGLRHSAATYYLALTKECIPYRRANGTRRRCLKTAL